MVVLCEKAVLTRLSDKFIYDRQQGLLLDRKTLKDRSYETKRGYRRITFEGKPYLLHRLVFFYHYGFFPKVVDHIDGNVYNNCIENLQGCNQKVNIEKAKIFNTNKTGFKGVSYHQAAGKYEAYFWKNYEKIYCGLHATAEEAHQARIERKYSHNETNS
jgi:hypothetical protein